MQPNKEVEKLNLDVDLNSNNAANILFEYLKSTGCAVLKNHKVPVHLLRDMFNNWDIYFSDNRKLNWLRKEETDEGFIPLNIEMARKGETPDYKELYQAHYHKPLPDILDQSITLKMFSELVSLGEKLCGLLDFALPAEIKRKMSTSLCEMVKGSNNHLLRIIHYPSIEKGINIPRSAIHTDICLLTFVFGAAFNGLELQAPNGEMYVPKVNDDAIVVFNGDMLEWGTDGYFKGTPHQVEANPNRHNESRYSIVGAIHPRRSVNLWAGKTAGEYLRDRLNSMGYKGDLLYLEDN
jgi:isopenicillin N synthase-like dioxygenase